MRITASGVARGALCALVTYGVVLVGGKVVVSDGMATAMAAFSDAICVGLTLFFFTGSLFRSSSPDKVRGARMFGLAVASATILSFGAAALAIVRGY
jgi:hypothetical protein